MNYRDQKMCKVYLLAVVAMLVSVYLLVTFSFIGLYVHSLKTVEAEDGVAMTAGEVGYKTTNLIEKSVNVKDVEPLLLSSKTVEEPPVEVVKESRMNVSEDELYLLAKIINAEAGNQAYEGMIAVGNVVLNRVESANFPDTIRQVIYQKGQFSPVANGSINKKLKDEALQAARDVVKGVKVVDESIMFFYNPDISTSKWIFTREVVIKIGDHAFAI